VMWYNAGNMTQSRRVVKHIVWCHFERAKGESRNLFANRFPFVHQLCPDESGLRSKWRAENNIFLGLTDAI
ncbi:MAG: hypothetical protein WBL85_01135, partial [Sedimentisphaerales bacterium]